MTSITDDELTYALKEIRMWLQPEEKPGTAYRGYVLHPEDVVQDILIAVANRPPGE